MKAFFIVRVSVILGLLTLAACHGDDLPDTTVSSKKLDTNQIRVDVRAQAQDAETDVDDNGVHFLVTLYRERSNGVIQFVNLAEGDSLSLLNGATSVPLTKNYYPDDDDIQGVDYSVKIDDIVDGAQYGLSLNRQSGSTTINPLVTVLPPTDFSVVPSATPLTPTGSVTLNWTPITGYEYQVSFRFSCGANGDQNVQGIRFPNHKYPSPPVSPFVFEFNDYFDFPPDTGVPSNVTNCQLRATLWSFEDQSELTANAFEEVNVSSVRVQRISTTMQRQ